MTVRMDQSSKRAVRERKRGRRKPKPIYERNEPMYFGNGFDITYNDLRDVAAALNDKDRKISAPVKAVVPTDLLKALDKVPTANQQLAICRLLAKMHDQNLEQLECALNAFLKK